MNIIKGYNKRLMLLRRRIFFAILLFVICQNITLLALQNIDSLSSKTSNQTGQISTAPVEIDGKILFYVRGITSFPAQERARIIAERIIKLAEDKSFNPDSIQIIEEQDKHIIKTRGEIIVRLVDADADIEGIDRKLLAEMARLNIIKAINSYRYERSSELFFQRIIFAVIATVLLIIILFILQFASRRFDKFLQVKLKSRLEGLESQSYSLIQAKQLWSGLYGVIKTIKFLLILLLILFYIHYVLGLFPLTRPIAKDIFSLFIKPLSVIGNSILASLPNIAFLIVLIIVVRYLLKLIKLLFKGLSQGTILITNFDTDWALPTYKIIRFLIIVFTIVIAYPYIPGSESDAFKGVSVLLGIMFSIGSSSFISNIVAGYSLTYRRAFKLADWIRVGDDFGEVIDIKQFVTRIRTLKNEEVIIPNSNLINSQVINYSSLAKKNGLIIHSNVGIGYETPWRLVEEMLKTAADRTEGLLKEPSPFVLQKTLGDFAIVYEINAYCNEPSRMMRIYSALHQNILDIFNENNVQIMTPAYEGDPAEPKVVSKDKWHTPLQSSDKKQ
jgi:small-conductance mechanosensitive channel